jgi:hypothetical protein
MLTIREIKADKKSGLRQFEITDHDREVKVDTEGNDLSVIHTLQGTYNVGKDEDGNYITKDVIFLPKGNSVNQIGVALSKFDQKTKDMTDKYIELEYRNSVTRSTTSAPSSSKIDRFATADEKAELALMEESVKGRANAQATERDIAWYKVLVKKYNAHLAECKHSGVEPTMAKPHNPESQTGSFIDRLTEEQRTRYQEIIVACDARKKDAPKASRKLSDEEKADRRAKAAAEAEAEFMKKYGN